VDLDLRGQECPVPTLKTVETLKRLKGRGETVVVRVDDAVCATDIPYEAGRLGYGAETNVSGTSEWVITLTPRL
jgi:TusA-related sulfurtransferase